jgi:predicted nucleic acid-binding protein
MGVIALPPSGRVYVDTSPVIYLIERVEPYLSASGPLWAALNAGTQTVVTSQLTLLEVLVKPLRDGNTAVANLFRSVLLGTVGLSCEPISLTILEAAAQIRAAHNLRAPDAIHAATALDAGCVLFVTNDAVFRHVPGLNVSVLSEVVAS